MPAGVTMTSFLRPLKKRLPPASNSPMSPVRYHPSSPATGTFSFASRQNLADRAFAEFEGVIEADERSSLSQAIALNDRIAESIPEFFGLAIEGGSARDECPELPAEAATNLAKDPPAMEEVLALGTVEYLREGGQSPGVFEIPLDFVLERLQEAGNRKSRRLNSSHIPL